MVVCQYFLRGTCKFGSNCRNEHSTGGMGFGKSSSFGAFSKNQLGPSGSNAFTNWKGSGNADNSVEKIIQLIKQEMNLWEVSKMWPFSCFSHQKESPCFSGLLDYSPEEIRIEAYKSKESGNPNEYLNNVKQLTAQFAKRRAELKSLTAASWEQEKQKLSGQGGLFASQSSGAKSLFSDPSVLFSSQSNQSGNNNPFASAASNQTLFANSTGRSIFGQQPGPEKTSLFVSNQTSLFGSGTSNQSASFGSGTALLFGSGSASTFGSSQQTSAFASRQQTVFGGSQQSVFGGNQQSGFGGSQQSQFSGQQSPFGGQQPAFGGSQSSAFGRGQAAVLQGQQSTAGIGQQALFGSGRQPNVVGGLFSQGQQEANRGLFTQSNLFGQNSQQHSSLFEQTKNTLASTATASVQSETTATTSGAHNPFLQAAMQNKQQESASAVADITSDLKLSEKDIEAYKADRFVLGQVPECPPPPELC